MPTAKTKKPPKEVEADDLVRETAGSYVSGDARFEVRQSDANWYVVDREQTNEFGQELIHGPFGSLKAAKTAMPGARDVKPLLRSQARPKKQAPEKKKAPPPPPSWIDKLPRDEAAEVRKQIRALETEGIDSAEALVRRDRQGLLPAVATALLRRRLTAAIEDLPEKDRSVARRLIGDLDEVIASGSKVPASLTGWALVELDPAGEPARRRIRLGN